jgi:hypothetical protein
VQALVALPPQQRRRQCHQQQQHQQHMLVPIPHACRCLPAGCC